MATYDFLCLDCGETFELDSRRPIEGTRVRCPQCGATHVRQTFESYMRNALSKWSTRMLDEKRCEHFG